MPSLKMPDQLAQQALVLDDADVGLDVGVARDAFGEEREIGRAADGVELLASAERFNDGDVIDSVADVLQLEDRAVDALVRVEQEVFGPELCGRVDDGDGDRAASRQGP